MADSNQQALVQTQDMQLTVWVWEAFQIVQHVPLNKKN